MNVWTLGKLIRQDSRHFTYLIDQNGDGLIHLAVINNAKKVLVVLLGRNNKLIENKNRVGKNPVELAVEHQGDILRILVNLACAPRTQEALNKKLLQSIKQNDINEALKALELGADPNALEKGESALWNAIALNQKVVVKKLIELGADVNFVAHSISVIEIAISKSKEWPYDKDLVKILLEAGAQAHTLKSKFPKECKYFARDIEQSEIKSLFKSVNEKDNKKLSKLAKNAEYLKITNDQGQTPLHLAVLNKDKKAIVTILGNNPKLIETKNNQGETALQLAFNLNPVGTNEIFHLLMNIAFGKNRKNQPCMVM